MSDNSWKSDPNWKPLPVVYNTVHIKSGTLMKIRCEPRTRWDDDRIVFYNKIHSICLSPDVIVLVVRKDEYLVNGQIYRWEISPYYKDTYYYYDVSQSNGEQSK